jgi:2-oxoisovalerate dehydrogenase E1 component
LNKEILLKAYKHICQAKAMAAVYEANRSICKYVHSTSRGHEAIQLATAYNLLSCDYVSPYYRDESIMLGLGFSPYTLMLQLLAKGEDIFTGGRSYYNHPNYRGADKPTIIHQSSATGMQAIPTTGVAQGVKYMKQLAVGNWQEAVGKLQGANSNGQHPITNESTISTEQISPDSYRDKLPTEESPLPIVICSLGDASVTEGEVSEAFQFAALHQLPIIFLVQDNDWGISVTSAEARTSNAYEFIQGFKGIKRESINGADFVECFSKMQTLIKDVRENCVPYLVHAKVPLLGHHTSGVRKDFYRTEEELQKSSKQDPYIILKEHLLRSGISEALFLEIENEAATFIQAEFNKAVAAAEPIANADLLLQDVFVPTPITIEKGNRTPKENEKVLMAKM